MTTARPVSQVGLKVSTGDLNSMGSDGDGDASPYPLLAELRASGSVHRGWPDLQISGDGDRPAYYSAYSFDAVRTVLADGETFNSSVYKSVTGPLLGRTILEMDPPEHGIYRAIQRHAFARSSMSRWETDLVEPLVRRTVESLVTTCDGKVDLVDRLFTPIPVRVIAAVLGLPEADIPWFHRLGTELISFRVDLKRAHRASAELGEYFSALIAQRRADPQDDMISLLTVAEADGVKLTEEEILGFLRNLLPAGGETTARSSASLMMALLNNPDQLAAVTADRGLLPQAIEEGIRWETPLLNFIRETSKDTELDGVAIPKGTTVVVNLGAANHDTTRWPDPTRFDIFRERKAHVGFGHGPHLCLGMHLARLETTVMMNAVLDLMPNIRLDPDAPAPYVSGMIFRSPPRLDVCWG